MLKDNNGTMRNKGRIIYSMIQTDKWHLDQRKVSVRCFTSQQDNNLSNLN